jgi:hypothetical protein
MKTLGYYFDHVLNFELSREIMKVPARRRIQQRHELVGHYFGGFLAGSGNKVSKDMLKTPNLASNPLKAKELVTTKHQNHLLRLTHI